MNKFYLLLPLILISSSLFTQNILPLFEEQPEWTVERSWYPEEDEPSFEIWYYQYGTYQQFCGQEWLEIVGELEGANDPHIVGYYREEGLQGWFRKDTACTAEVYLMFDFSLEVLDTFQMPVAAIGSSAFFFGDAIVIDKDTLADEVIKISFYFVNNSSAPYYEWIMGIGAVTDPFRLLDYCFSPSFVCENLVRTRCLKKK